MAANLRVERVNALPETKTASTLYMVKSAVEGLFDLYVTGTNAAEVRHIISKSEISGMIASAVTDFTNIRVVADIAARNALAPTRNTLALVLDATTDATVDLGAALYVFDNESEPAGWVKVSEFESLDVVLDWSAIQNRPSSSVAAIDDAVSKVHVHDNKTELDKIGQDASGNLTYNGANLQAYITTADW